MNNLGKLKILITVSFTIVALKIFFNKESAINPNHNRSLNKVSTEIMEVNELQINGLYLIINATIRGDY